MSRQFNCLSEYLDNLFGYADNLHACLGILLECPEYLFDQLDHLPGQIVYLKV